MATETLGTADGNAFAPGEDAESGPKGSGG